MKIKLYPSTISGTIEAIPSKSYLHRALIGASLANGTSIIENFYLNDDIIATIKALEELGAKIAIQGNQAIIEGIDVDTIIKKDGESNVKQSGSTLRFLIPLFSLLFNSYTYQGDASLFTRPLDEYKVIFKKYSLNFNLKANSLYIKGSIKPDHYNVSCLKSSQFITGLLFALPLLEKDSTIRISNNKQINNYILMTIEVLKLFNINIIRSYNLIQIPGKQRYQAANLKIEGDYSSSAFYFALSTLSHPLQINNLNHSSLQGDKKIVKILNNANGKVDKMNSGYKVYNSQLDAFNCSLKNAIDLGPIIIVLALFTQNQSVILDTKNLIYKESDRLNSLLNELNKVGAKYEKKDNELIIFPLEKLKIDQPFNSYNDHRLVMALTLFVAKTKEPYWIEGVEAINKSYPTFFSDLKQVGINFELVD